MQLIIIIPGTGATFTTPYRFQFCEYKFCTGATSGTLRYCGKIFVETNPTASIDGHMVANSTPPATDISLYTWLQSNSTTTAGTIAVYKNRGF